MQPVVALPLAVAAALWWCSAATVSAWNITRLYGTSVPARLTDVAVWRNRAYACWPRADAAQPVTLLELPWPETKERPWAPARWTPRRSFHADQQKIGDCRFVQSAVAVDLDKIRGHLYVLDGGYGNNSCQPKIVVFDLKIKKFIRWTELNGLNGSGLTALVVDARPFNGRTRVYIGDANGRGHLTVFDPNRSIWYRVALLQHAVTTAAEDAADGRSDDDVDVPAEHVAVSKFRSCVFLTSARSHSFYSASFNDLRNLTSYYHGYNAKNGDTLPIGLQVCREDDKVGNSSGLYADIQGGLNYVYTRDFVALRFVPGAGVGVEEHTVVLQSHESLPAVTKIFTDNLNYLQVWALNAVPNAENRHTVKINTLHKQSVTARA
ncbi:uncharacterized protein LOC112693016 [Sipha flava]|uniref:Uncharacterized protein LOC112693016 n=2 Tax=Sipha flava TaxID=143950 RepID=A0A8B8GKA9_9HEMI|nr:uncharacterized protein LOC112693016 [Sipha flava]